jgi:hypothetical protein
VSVPVTYVVIDESCEVQKVGNGFRMRSHGSGCPIYLSSPEAAHELADWILRNFPEEKE